MPVSFDNTRIAFSSQTDSDLTHSYWLFKLVSSPAFVNVGKHLTNLALMLQLPIKWIIKPTVFKHFCGGETVEESRKKMEELARQNIKSILDYSAEGKESESDFDNCTAEIISIIREASHNENIGFAVFKPTGIARFALMEKVSDIGYTSISEKQPNTSIPPFSALAEIEKREYDRVYERFNRICKSAHDASVPLFIDAEESWIQRAVDKIVNDMMQTYNKQKPIVYNTFQMYRKDRLEYLIECFAHAQKENYFIGAKLVRGAYMEKERARAAEKGYDSPINVSKEISDSHYNNALLFCLEHLDRVAFCCASHNEKSSMLVVEKMKEKNLPANHSHIYFSQLLGMSDHISYNLASAGYNVSKYVPYGPVREVLPYLIRRAQENTSVKGQTGRELGLILKERERRKSKLPRP
ncbi:MAG: proline dehydrogenase [Bacteroidetes bacterium]|nr:MAG: proline dehydrogenase [Bacteroidota bacterium]